MKFKDFYKTIADNKFYVFSYQDIRSFYQGENRENLKKMIYRWKRKGWIYPLKRGLYELTYPEDFNIPDLYIANKLYTPSYISLETALSIYSIIPEVSMAVTSVTTKPTRKFKNKHGLFLYRSVKPKSFCGYYVEIMGSYEILIAEPEKALVDFLYFNKKLNFERERFDKKIISELDKSN